MSEQLAYTYDDFTLQPSHGNVSTIYPLKSDKTNVQPAVKLAWEFNPTTILKGDAIGQRWDEAAERSGHVTNMWREAPNGLYVERATAFKSQVSTKEIVQYGETNDTDTLAMLQAEHAKRKLVAEDAALAEAALVSPEATIEEAELIIGFVRDLPNLRQGS